MSQPILSQTSASVSQLKKNPMATVAAGDGSPVAILKHNEPVFYCIPADAYAALIERMEDLELNAIANERVSDGQPVITVTLDELRTRISPRCASRMAQTRRWATAQRQPE